MFHWKMCNICAFVQCTYISEDHFEGLWIVQQIVEVVESILQLYGRVNLNFRVGESFEPFCLCEVAHVLGVHLESDAEHSNIFWFQLYVLAKTLHSVGTELRRIICCVPNSEEK